MNVLSEWVPLDLVDEMLRLTLVLCAGMFAALLIAGADRGQLRPGLAKAVAEGRLTPDLVAVKSPEVAPEPERVVMAEAAPAPKPKPAVVAASYTPVTEAPPPPREVVQALEEPVFTLSALPTEPIPAAEPQPEAAASGKIYYVTADSVNVRQGPSTDTAVLGKLASGEAALVVQDVGGEWARIVIEGDGIEGYVALRFLSPLAP